MSKMASSKPRQLRNSYTRLMSLAMILLGLALVARTVAAGGGPVSSGVLLGILFVLAGAARLYLQLRAR
jgi:hypothetical protein